MFYLEYDSEGKPLAFYNSNDGDIPKNTIPLRTDQYEKILSNPNLYEVKGNKLVERLEVKPTERNLRTEKIDKEHYLVSRKHLFSSLMDMECRDTVRLATVKSDRLVWKEVKKDKARTILAKLNEVILSGLESNNEFN